MRISKVRLPDGAHAALTWWDSPLGTGAPRIVAVHGLGHAGAAWAAFADAARARAEVIAIDLRGHGDSDQDPTGEYALGTLVSDLISVLGSLGTDGGRAGDGGSRHSRTVLVGHSLGGRLVAEVALQDLVRVAGAVVVDASPRPPDAWLAHLERLHAGPGPKIGDITEQLDRLAEMYPLAKREQLAPLAAATVRPAPGGGMEEKVDRAALRAWSRRQPRSPWPLRDGRTHLTLVRGEASSVLTRAVAAELLASGQVDEVVEVRRAGHGVLLDNPVGLMEAVLSTLTFSVEAK